MLQQNENNLIEISFNSIPDINKFSYKATFCHNKESPDIFKALSKLYCDKKMLLNHRKKLNDSNEINIMRSDINQLKDQMNQIITLLKNKE